MTHLDSDSEGGLERERESSDCDTVGAKELPLSACEMGVEDTARPGQSEEREREREI